MQHWPIDENRLYTVGEVSSILRASQKKVYRMLKAKELPGHKVGSEWRIAGKTLIQYFA